MKWLSSWGFLIFFHFVLDIFSVIFKSLLSKMNIIHLINFLIINLTYNILSTKLKKTKNPQLSSHFILRSEHDRLSYMSFHFLKLSLYFVPVLWIILFLCSLNGALWGIDSRGNDNRVEPLFYVFVLYLCIKKIGVQLDRLDIIYCTTRWITHTHPCMPCKKSKLFHVSYEFVFYV